MNYSETLTYLYNSAPLFQHIGKDAYKEGLTNTHLLDEYFGHPHHKFRTIHVAGTNGKGSCSHTIAAVLQAAGYKTGLYTSPHLIDFRERIRVDGQPISQEFVVDFVEQHRAFFEPLHPSFFELTTAMAFLYFAQEEVDIAVIEVGLGGRLDCTNIIHPDLCVITNISFDHVQFLGDTLAKIATEKAGIIKPQIPVVIGETTPETKPVFQQQAVEMQAPIHFAEEEHFVQQREYTQEGYCLYQTTNYSNLIGELGGFCQEKNTNTILSALHCLKQAGYHIDESHIRKGFSNVCKLTGLMGRWQRLEEHPALICDTGHNVGGISYIVQQLAIQKYNKLHMIIGMVNDKDISGVLKLLPSDAAYYFTQASVQRALPAEKVKELAQTFSLHGEAYPDVQSALTAAKEKATAEDLIFVGGSSFIVADLLKMYHPHQ
ncbi:folylpolyglutamate synthase/dihydrofolate synthase family protein [Phocaeicola sp. HCN-40430]|uniref:bifunctional folylpolyglutamate synthase/dihydrofolate synthase n=1 Tax=Phocaeicola sp. HCN-40430 TaxID=3134664 RepID=UPI0030C637F3